MLTEQEISEAVAQANETDPESISYMEAPIPEFGNASLRAGVAFAHSRVSYTTTSRLAYDDAIYKGQIFYSNGEVMHTIKLFF